MSSSGALSVAYRSLLALTASVSLAALSAGAAHAQAAGGATQLEQIDVQGQGQGAATGQGGGGTVGGTPGVATSDGYVAKTTRTATKTDLPINETPATVNTVTAKQLEDRRPQNLQDALSYTPGVRTGLFGYDPRFDSFTIRGVDVTYSGVFRDGLRQYNSPSGLFRLEPYGLEQISILKGPASSLYGASASVGIVDLVSKRPTDYKFGEIEAQTGSFDRVQGAFDFGGPANEEGTVLYRFTGLARDADTQLANFPDDRVFFAPAVTIKPSDDTKITFLGEYMDATTGGSAAYGNTYGSYTLKNGVTVPVSTGANGQYLSNTSYNDFRQKQGRIGYEFEHQFNDNVSVHQNLRFSALGTDEEYASFDPVSASGYNGLVKENVKAISTDTFVKTKIETGPAQHTVLTGLDAGYMKYNSRIGFGGVTDPNDISDPVLPDRTRQKQSMVGAYIQDEIKLDAWRLLLTGRHDWLDSTYFVPADTSASGLDEQNKQKKGAFTGRAGLSYVTSFGLTPFVSYGTSFNANSGTVIDPDGTGPATGGVAKPTRGEQAEAGFKYAVPGYNASINATAFWLKQVDGIVYDVDGSGLNKQIQLDFRSRGFEVEGVATLNNGISLLANYSYTDVKILKLSDDTDGKRLNSVPKHAFSLWAGYETPYGPLKGLGVGAGVRFSGASFGDNFNRAVLRNEARAFVDGKISYDFEAIDPKLKGVRLQVNGYNLFDKVEQVCTAGYCYYDEGRKVIASLRYRW